MDPGRTSWSVMDRIAFEDLYRRHYPGLAASARGYLGDASGAEDVVQDVFLAVWHRRRELKVRGSMRTYLHVAVRNASLDRLKYLDGVRRHRTTVATTMSRPARSPDSALRERELADAVEAAIHRLPERAREVFIMSRSGGLSYAEIAAALEVSVKAVEASMSRALRSLRTQLAPHFEEDPAPVG